MQLEPGAATYKASASKTASASKATSASKASVSKFAASEPAPEATAKSTSEATSKTDTYAGKRIQIVATVWITSSGAVSVPC